MKKARAWMTLALVAVGLAVMGVESAMAADPAAPAGAPVISTLGPGLKVLGGGLGAGLVVLGGAMGIGRIGAAAVESMARQPEVAGTVNTAMLITAAMIEGATLFGVLGCFLACLN